MPQNLVSLDLPAGAVAELDKAIAVLEDFTRAFITLTAQQKHDLFKMGDKSTRFCEQTEMVLAQNRDVLPPGFDFAEMQGDLADYRVLEPRTLRLREVLAKMEDTQMALGSDVIVAASEGYALMKMFGKAEGLGDLQDAMRVRRPGRPRRDPPPAA